MDNYSIEELKRQRDSARSKAQDAAKAYEAAKARLEAALATESGWLGQVVEVNASRYLVREVQSLSDSPWKLLASPFKEGRQTVECRSCALPLSEHRQARPIRTRLTPNPLNEEDGYAR